MVSLLLLSPSFYLTNNQLEAEMKMPDCAWSTDLLSHVLLVVSAQAPWPLPQCTNLENRDEDNTVYITGYDRIQLVIRRLALIISTEC